jgi:hypothetical protein
MVLAVLDIKLGCTIYESNFKVSNFKAGTEYRSTDNTIEYKCTYIQVLGSGVPST